ncbi:MAG TPA: serine hydrolase domain-containing protein [Steroidobacteraceae bacterium]
MKAWRLVAALLACSVTAVMVSFPHLGPASKSGPPMDLSSGDTPAHIQLERVLAAFNSGDRDTFDRYRQENVSPYWTHAPTGEMAVGWFKKTGVHRVLTVQDLSPNYLVALLRNEDSDELFQLGVEVEREQPHRLMYLTLNYASNVPEEYWPRRLSDEEVTLALRGLLERREPAGKFSGAVLVRHGDETLFRGGVGFANREAATRNTADTRFRIGRLTDMFTAVAILRLAQDGRLGVDDSLGSLLPELEDDDVGKISLGRLLSNSAGTEDIEHLGWNSDRRRRRSLSELVDEFGDANLLWKTGKHFRYSSLGYVLLAAVVERASGRSYGDYIREVILQPAGMTATDFDGDQGGGARAKPYQRPAGTAEWLPMSDPLCCRGAPSSDAYSTVDDIARFLVALDRRRLLDDAHTRTMLAQHAYMWGRTHHGYGLATEAYDDGSQWITHEDGVEGQNSGLMFRPATGHLVIALGNFDAPTAIQVVRFVGARFPPEDRLVEMNIAPK